MTLDVKRTGSGDATLEFSPALSLRSEVASVELNGHSLPFHAETNATDQHVSMRIPINQAATTVRIHLKNDFGVSAPNVLPALGSPSQGLRVISESWNANRTQMTLSLSGLAGRRYELLVWNPSQVTSVHGGKLESVRENDGVLAVEFSGNSDSYVQQDVILDFAKLK